MIIHKEQVDISKIKLIIWDLDNTFWQGTMTEGGCKQIPEHAEMIKDLSKRGIVNSICSKNTFEDCEKILREWDLWDYFVFPSIDWTPKRQRVGRIISDMNLRPDNVLFLDDEPSNLEAAGMEQPTLMCSTADEVADELLRQCEALRQDPEMSRLKRYQELQTKVEKRKEYASDEEFLRLSDIHVSMTENCMEQFDRVLELINRTNQLNFTKIRMEADRLNKLLNNADYRCGYISCRDKFSNYGIVGFYALNCSQNRLEHFLFSCRTIGMGVEQFVYAELGYPALEIVGNVVTKLDPAQKPDWVVLETKLVDDVEKAERIRPKIIVKGPCDVSQVLPFFSDGAEFETEFAYVSNTKKGTYIEGHNHSSQIVQLLREDRQMQEYLIQTVPFIDEEFYKSTLFTVHYDYFIFSVLSDYSLGMYRSKENPKIIIPFGQYTSDYTQKDNWEQVKGIFGAENELEKKRLFEQFCDSYEPIGRITDEQFLKNLELIRNHLPFDTVIIFLNGAEKPYPEPCPKKWIEREKVHSHMNQLLDQFAAEHANCTVIDVNRCLGDDPMPYLDTINHYKKNIYYQIAVEIQNFIERDHPQFHIETSRTIKKDSLRIRLARKIRNMFRK